MCIAIGVMKGQPIPSREILETCWIHNDDGAGFAFNHDGAVYIKKGFMTFDAFYEAITAWDQEVNLTDKGVLIHFRIATHGARNATMTHPFPIHTDEGALKKTEFISEYAVIHNGIIQLTASDAYKSNGLSDTAIFVRDYLYYIAQNRHWFSTKTNMELVHNLIGSKMMCLNPNGDIIRTEGFTKDNGVWYSNSSYKDTYSKRKVTNVTSNAYYGDYDYGSYGTGYGYTSYGASNANNNYTSNTTSLHSNFQSIKMMRCNVGDTVEVDDGATISTAIHSEADREYFIDQYGQIFGGTKAEIPNTNFANEYALWDFEYLGMGKFYDVSTKERDFCANVTAFADQFLSEYSAPANVPVTETTTTTTAIAPVVDATNRVNH